MQNILSCTKIYIFLQELTVVDHERIYYRPFRKNFYVEVPEIAKLEQEGKKNFRKVIGFIRLSDL